MFNYCSSKAGNIQNGRRDVTLQVDELLELLRKANLLESKTTDIQLEEIVNMVEKYYAPETTLKAKLEQERFDSYIAANPMLKRANQEAAARKQRQEEAKRRAEQRKLEAEGDSQGEEQQPEEVEQEVEEDQLDEEARKARDEAELQELHANWKA